MFNYFKHIYQSKFSRKETLQQTFLLERQLCSQNGALGDFRPHFGELSGNVRTFSKLETLQLNTSRVGSIKHCVFALLSDSFTWKHILLNRLIGLSSGLRLRRYESKYMEIGILKRGDSIWARILGGIRRSNQPLFSCVFSCGVKISTGGSFISSPFHV